VDDEQRDPDSGKYTKRFSDAEVVDVVSDLEPAGTVNIAEELGCTQQSAYDRLRALEEAGDVTSEMIGGNRVWMLPSKSE
jgi:hypothetical protein